MGFQWFEGFDLYETGTIFDLVGGFWGASGTIANVNVTTPRTGSRCLEVYNTNTRALRAAADFVDDCYLGCAFLESSFGSAPAVTVSMGPHLDAATADLRVVRSGVGGTYSLYRGTTLLASGTGVYANGAYHYCLLYYNRTTGAAKVWIDRVLEIDIPNGITSIGAVSGIGLGAIGNSSGAGQPTRYDDVFYWTDPSAAEITAIELTLDFSVKYGFPDANGATQQWTVTGAANAWDAINNVPPDPAQYIEGANALDVSNFGFENISSGVFEIFALSTFYYGEKTTAGTGNIQESVDANGTLGAGSDDAQATTYAYWENYFATNPATGVAWTPGDLGTIGVSFERTA